MESPNFEALYSHYAPLVDDPAAFRNAILRPLPRAFRVNTLKADCATTVARLRAYGFGVTPLAWTSAGFIASTDEISATIEYFRGRIYLQEEASMLPPLVVREELSQGPTVLDACAAPGSKSTQIAALLSGRGFLVANDVDYSRIRALKFHLSRCGVVNAAILNADARRLRKMSCDVIILDAPCSSDGTVRRNAEIARNWRPEKSEKHTGLQRALITALFDLLNPGGVMVYSTCSFAPEENECIVNHLALSRAATLEPIDIPGVTLSPALKSWRGMEFDPQVSHSRRVWPHHNDTGGFFLARIRK